MATNIKKPYFDFIQAIHDKRISVALNRVFQRVWPQTQTVTASRILTPDDDGRHLECTTTLTLTMPAGMPLDFRCTILASGTTSIASSGGALLNGATTTVTRAAASNATFQIVPRASAADSYIVTGS